MRSIFEYIWGALYAIAKRVLSLWRAVWSVLSSFVTWIVGVITYVVTQVNDWIESAIESGISAVTDAFSDVALETFPDCGAWAAYWLDIFSFTDAVTMLVDLFIVWVAARSARLLMVPIRALLELL